MIGRDDRRLVAWPEAEDDQHRPGLLLRFGAILLIALGLWIAGSVAAHFIGKLFA